jgi:hypothetical protein
VENPELLLGGQAAGNTDGKEGKTL